MNEGFADLLLLHVEEKIEKWKISQKFQDLFLCFERRKILFSSRPFETHQKLVSVTHSHISLLHSKQVNRPGEFDGLLTRRIVIISSFELTDLILVPTFITCLCYSFMMCQSDYGFLHSSFFPMTSSIDTRNFHPNSDTVVLNKRKAHTFNWISRAKTSLLKIKCAAHRYVGEDGKIGDGK